jgi:hypothetical protein
VAFATAFFMDAFLPAGDSTTRVHYPARKRIGAFWTFDISPMPRR